VKVDINFVQNNEEEMAVINVVSMTDDILNAVDILSNDCRQLPVKNNAGSCFCETKNIYYIESVDKRSYVYTKDSCYETKYRLYELEKMLNKNFLRISKAMILNIRKIKMVKAELNGRMVANLLNGESVVIARSYVKDLKERLGV